MSKKQAKNRFEAAKPDLALVNEEKEELSAKELLETAAQLVDHADRNDTVILQRINAMDHPIPFCLLVDKSYVDPAHLWLIGDALKEVEDYISSGGLKGNGRLIITVPPRHGKTLTVSKRWPAQLIGKYSDWRIALVSYSAELSTDASRALRSLVRDEPMYRMLFPNAYLSDESASVQRWALAGKSPDDPSVVAVGVGGPLTGRGFHLIIVDDPLKGRAEAESVAERENLKAWYRGTLRTRLEPGGAIVIIQTRWHEDDLVGFLLEEAEGDGEEWKVINLPAYAVDEDAGGEPITDPLERKKGEVLWKDRFTKAMLESTRKALGPYDWESQYQGFPKPAGGAKIKRDWLKYVEPISVPKGLTWKRYWDLAISTKESASYTASARCAVDEFGNIYIAGVIRGRWEWPQQRSVIKATMIAEKVLEVEHGIESALHGTAAVQDFVIDKELLGIPMRAIHVHQDKLTRALPWIALASAGMVYMVKGRWNAAFVKEAVSFTGKKDKYDDQIDAVSGAVKMLGQSEAYEVLTASNPFYG